DYVFVPALHRPDDPTAVAFIKSQAAKGATIVGICAGVLTLGEAGLLDGRQATTHWYVIDDLRRAHPTMQWARDRRYVADRGVVTTTGVTASVPVSLAIVEAIAGRARAEALARELGVTDWSARHDSDAFNLGAGGVTTALGNTLAFWGHQTVGIPVSDGVDEIALALTANAYAITYRSRAVAISPAARVTTRRGLHLVPDQARAEPLQISAPSDQLPVRALDAALEDLTRRYGRDTSDFVALLLEYPRPSPGPRPSP
ncbi:MAG TPA: DJ-1/PfpI family protein, partial [Myxococcaceae bacterium]|nr:DJ-1/PfpI family protein [Myxococcaceae bacterium]